MAFLSLFILLLLRTLCASETSVLYSFDPRQSNADSTVMAALSKFNIDLLPEAAVRVLSTDSGYLDGILDPRADLFLNVAQLDDYSPDSWIRTCLLNSSVRTFVIRVDGNKSVIHSLSLPAALPSLKVLRAILNEFSIGDRFKVSAAFLLSVLESASQTNRGSLHDILEFLHASGSYAIVETGDGIQHPESVFKRTALAIASLIHHHLPLILIMGKTTTDTAPMAGGGTVKGYYAEIGEIDVRELERKIPIYHRELQQYTIPAIPMPTIITVPSSTPVINPGPTLAAQAPPTIVAGQTWCVARSGNPIDALQEALDYACGFGGADCSQIQQGSSCFNPDTLENHASYAFNSYFQRNPILSSCDFEGLAVLVYTNPSSTSCVYPSSSLQLQSPAIPMAPQNPSLLPPPPPIFTSPSLPLQSPAILTTPQNPSLPPPPIFASPLSVPITGAGSSPFPEQNISVSTPSGAGSIGSDASPPIFSSVSISMDGKPLSIFFVLASQFLVGKIIFHI